MLKNYKIIGGIAIGALILTILVFVIISIFSKELVCKSEYGDITIKYDDEGITEYGKNDFNYEIDLQNKLVKETGIEKYIENFSKSFEANTGGKCK